MVVSNDGAGKGAAVVSSLPVTVGDTFSGTLSQRMQETNQDFHGALKSLNGCCSSSGCCDAVAKTCSLVYLGGLMGMLMLFCWQVLNIQAFLALRFFRDAAGVVSFIGLMIPLAVCKFLGILFRRRVVQDLSIPSCAVIMFKFMMDTFTLLATK